MLSNQIFSTSKKCHKSNFFSGIPGKPLTFVEKNWGLFKTYVNESIMNSFVSNRKLRKHLKEAEECITRLQEQLRLENVQVYFFIECSA